VANESAFGGRKLEDKEFYSSVYPRFVAASGSFRAQGARSKFAWISSRLTVRPGDRLLEIGCDTGVMLRLFEGLGAECHGIDLSAEAVVEANHPRIVQASATEIPHGDGEFDICVSSHVIEHLEDPADLLREARRVLKPNGVLALLYPWEPFRGMVLIPAMVANGQMPWPETLSRIHRHLVTPAMVRALGSPIGWQEMESGTFWPFPYTVPQYYSVLKKAVAS
jgi:2-polyprenyl-3-methyl-5-hydroxy-6-metoxy-1,4-benzoquinol methylase